MEPRPRVILLFGSPGSGVTAAARVMAAAGARVVADAGQKRRFGVFARLDALATDVASAVDAGADAPRLGVAVRAIKSTLPDGGEPVLVVAGAMGRLPRFWLRAFAKAGVETRPALLRGDPLAAPRPGPPRAAAGMGSRAILELLCAAPEQTVVIGSSAIDLRPLALGDRSVVARGGPKHAADNVGGAPIVPDEQHALDRLLNEWPSLAPAARKRAAEALRRRFKVKGAPSPDRREAVAEPAAASAVAPATVRAAGSAPSPLLFHFHIFKNAGTSVDRMLKANFGDAWVEREFSPGPLAKRQREVHDALAERPDLHAFSSHTAPLPPPMLDGRSVFPIILVRHPLLRIRSAYAFERRQDAQTRGATLAKQTDLRGYVTALLDQPKLRLARDFQTLRFAAGTPGPAAQELRRALATLARLPFVGLVEAYDASVERLGALVRPLFPGFEAVALHENVTSRGGGTTADRLAALRAEIGDALFDRLLAENVGDLELFERVSASYA